ncbi:hypothetical protein D3C76_1634100 [compost metagenome]
MAAGIDHVLPLLHHAQITVIQVEHQHRQVVLQCGGEFLNIHLNTAIAGHADHRFIR